MPNSNSLGNSGLVYAWFWRSKKPVVPPTLTLFQTAQFLKGAIQLGVNV
jgi:hypothetical protein